MNRLKNEQIELIRSDLERRGLIYPPLREEIVDHVCDGVEAGMAEGLSFMDAYAQVLAAFGPRGLSALNYETIHAIGTTVMFKNYLRIAFRNLRRHKLHTFINLMGLVLGISSCLLILLYVLDEQSYDRHHRKADRIYRLTSRIVSEGKDEHVAWGPGFLAERLEKDYPEVEKVVRMKLNTGKITVKVTEDTAQGKQPKLFSLDKAYYVFDPAFFGVFTHPMLAGNPNTALQAPWSMVITRELAQQYFGKHWNAGKGILGRTIDLNGDVYTITGVIENVPATSDLPFRALLSVDAQKKQQAGWVHTFILFRDAPGGRNFGPKLEKIAGDLQAQNKQMGATIYFHLENLKDVHLGTPKLFDTPKTNRAYLTIFSIVAVFILLIAGINYINLSIAQSAARSTEVGIRKVVGAARVQLLFQFIGESVLLTFAAMIISLMLVAIVLPLYNQVLGKSFAMDTLFQAGIFLWLTLIFLLIGIVAGSYPAFYLASFDPVRVLKGRLGLGRTGGKSLLRQGLVVTQFSISIAMTISTLIVFGQLRFLRDTDLGFQKDQVLVIDIPDDKPTLDKMPLLKQALTGQAGIARVSLSGYNSTPGQDNDVDVIGFEKGGRLTTTPISNISVDENYLELLDIPLVAGRNVTTTDRGRKEQSFIVNEAVVRMMDWGKTADAALGKRVNLGTPDSEFEGKIVGVVKDFHFHSLHKPIEPMILLYDPEYPEKMLIRLTAGNPEDRIATIRTQWEKLILNHPFEFTFLDESFDQQYRNERRLMPVFTYFTFLTIFIAGLGLFGLVSFTTRQRTREIGIRKVMGAEEMSLVVLLSKEFLLLVLLSVLIASPLAWYAMVRWLEGFAYRTSIGFPAFLLAGCCALLLAGLTAGYQALRVARTKPVNTLRYE